MRSVRVACPHDAHVCDVHPRVEGAGTRRHVCGKVTGQPSPLGESQRPQGICTGTPTAVTLAFLTPQPPLAAPILCTPPSLCWPPRHVFTSPRCPELQGRPALHHLAGLQQTTRHWAMNYGCTDLAKGCPCVSATHAPGCHSSARCLAVQSPRRTPDVSRHVTTDTRHSSGRRTHSGSACSAGRTAWGRDSPAGWRARA